MRPYRCREGKLWEVDLCELKASQGPPLLRSLVGRWNIDLIAIIIQIIIAAIVTIIRHPVCSSSLYSVSPLHFWSSFLHAFVNRWLILLPASLIWCRSACLFLLLSLQTGDFAPSLCLSSALLAIAQSFSLQKVITHWAHQPGVNSPRPADWWVWEGGCRQTDSFFWAEIY